MTPFCFGTLAMVSPSPRAPSRPFYPELFRRQPLWRCGVFAPARLTHKILGAERLQRKFLHPRSLAEVIANPLTPDIQACVRCGGEFNDWRLWVHTPNPRAKRGFIKCNEWKQITLGQQDEIRLSDALCVSRDFIVSPAHAEDAHDRGLPKILGRGRRRGGALDEQDIQTREIQTSQSTAHQGRGQIDRLDRS